MIITDDAIYRMGCLGCGTLLLAVYIVASGKDHRPTRGLSVVVLALAVALVLAGLIGSTNTLAVLSYIGSAIVIVLVLLFLGVLT